MVPTDVSSPLLVWLARGNVALATVLNGVNTALAPLVVPVLFLALTGVELDVPVAALTGDLALTVLLPTVAGVTVRTWMGARLEPVEPAFSAVSTLAYLALLLAVVGPNAGAILELPATVAVIAAVVLALNLSGYAIAGLAWPLVRDPADRIALLFTVSKKEFSIAAVVVAASGLPAQVALPAVVYAVVQMVSSPLAARLLTGRFRTLASTP